MTTSLKKKYCNLLIVYECIKSMQGLSQFHFEESIMERAVVLAMIVQIQDLLHCLYGLRWKKHIENNVTYSPFIVCQ